MRIYIQTWLEEDDQLYLSERIFNDEFLFGYELEKQKRLSNALSADIIFGNVPAEWIEKSQKLKWLQLDSVGVDKYRKVNWENKDVTVTNMKGLYGIPVAETAIAGILALYRKINELVILKEEKRWNYKSIRPNIHLLHHKKVLVLGGGSIGLTLKRLFEAFECQVAVYGRDRSYADIIELSELEDIIPRVDLVVGALPETPETIQLMDAKRIALMNENSIFVNVGRGSLVDEQALIKALQQEKLAGVVLDVTHQEPMEPENPLWDLPNTILTQHTGGGFKDEGKYKIDIFLDNYDRFRHGDPLNNIVDFIKGY